MKINIHYSKYLLTSTSNFVEVVNVMFMTFWSYVVLRRAKLISIFSLLPF